ncbi:MAG: putative protein N(5)-glutamine methyltransferase, partial [Actinomycetota bacterium]
PYIPDAAVLLPDVAAEPPVALRGGQLGDELLRRIVDGSFDALVPDGALAMEVGTPSQARALEAAMRDAFSAVGVRDDHTDRPRVVWGRR